MTDRELMLEIPVQEPVAWLYRDSWGTMKLSQIMPPPVGAFPVYTAPQPRQWQGLTEISRALRRHGLTLVKTASGYDVINLGQITAHGITGEKNNG